MGNGYTRNDTSNNIADGNVINASDLDGEFDAVQAAFNGTDGHSHDGTSGEGPQIAAGGIASNAVITAKILDANVTTDKLANDAVTNAKMAVNSIDSDQYVDGSIDRVHLAADIVDGTKIADSSIDSEHYVDGSIDSVHLAADIVDGTKLADDAVDSEHYTDGSIDTAHIADSQITTAKIADNNVTTAKILDANVTTAKIAADAIDGTKIADDVIDSEHYVAGSIDAEHLAANSVTSAKLDTNIQVAGTLGVTGETTLTTHLNMGDGDIIKLGDSADLEIYHDGSNSYINEVGTGQLYIQATDLRFYNAASNKQYFQANDGAEVRLYYDNAEKLATKTDGVDITGELQADSLDIDGDADISGTLTMGGNIDLQDDDRLLIGTGDDLQIYFNGADGVINESVAGNLLIQGDNIYLQNSSASSSYLRGVNGGAVDLRYAGDTKLATKTDGVDITGELQSDSLDVDGDADISGTLTMGGNLTLQDNDYLQLGSSQDLQIYHNGTDSYIDDTGTGGLILKTNGTAISLTATNGETMATFNRDGAVNLYHDNVEKLATTSTGADITGDLGISNDVEVTGRSVGVTITAENDGSFDLAVGNDFTCTTTADTEITFTNAAAGQSGNIKFVNGGSHVITANALVAINADVLSTLNTTGTYHLAYYVTAYASGNDTILVSASAGINIRIIL